MLESKWFGCGGLNIQEIKNYMDRNDIINETSEFVLNRKTLSVMIRRNPQLLIDLNNFKNSADSKYTLAEIADLHYILNNGGFNVYNQCVNLFGKKYKLSVDDEVNNGKILLLNSNKDIVFEFEDCAIN